MATTTAMVMAMNGDDDDDSGFAQSLLVEIPARGDPVNREGRVG